MFLTCCAATIHCAAHKRTEIDLTRQLPIQSFSRSLLTFSHCIQFAGDSLLRQFYKYCTRYCCCILLRIYICAFSSSFLGKLNYRIGTTKEFYNTVVQAFKSLYLVSFFPCSLYFARKSVSAPKHT